MTDDRVTSTSNPAEISFELSSRNTGMALQRTRMSADRTLMSVIRTSLSLIGFGFTIAQLFEKLAESGTFKNGFTEAPRFGLALVVLGIMMLVLGIAYHAQFMLALRAGRKRMVEDGLIRGKSPFPPSLTLITALLLLGIGIAAMISMIFQVGPFD
jgi:putative membrane protein